MAATARRCSTVDQNQRRPSETWIRALHPDDREEMLAAIQRFSKEALYRRFFAPKRRFSERELEFYLNVDFKTHVALVAVLSEGERQIIVGGSRYIVAQPGRAEVAFAVDDQHQRLGIATRLIAHLILLARDARLNEFIAEVLPENMPMLKVFEQCGLPIKTRTERGVVCVTLALSTGTKS